MSVITVTTIGPRPNHLRKNFLHMPALVLMLGAAMSPTNAHAAATERATDISGGAQAVQVVGSEAEWKGLEWMLGAAGLDINRVALVADQPNVVGELRGDTSPARINARGASEYTVHLSPMELALAQSGDMAVQYTILHELGHAVQNEHRGRTMVPTEFLTEDDATALAEIFSATEMFGRTRREVALLADGEGEGFADAFASAALINHYGRTPAVDLALRAEAANRLENGPGDGTIQHNTYHGVGYYAIRRALSNGDGVVDVVAQAKMWSSQGVSDFILTTNGNSAKSILNREDLAFDLAEARERSLADAVECAARFDNPKLALEVANTPAELAYVEDMTKGGSVEIPVERASAFIEKAEESFVDFETNISNLSARVGAWRAANPPAGPGHARPVPVIGAKIAPGGR